MLGDEEAFGGTPDSWLAGRGKVGHNGRGICPKGIWSSAKRGQVKGESLGGGINPSLLTWDPSLAKGGQIYPLKGGENTAEHSSYLGANWKEPKLRRRAPKQHHHEKLRD